MEEKAGERESRQTGGQEEQSSSIHIPRNEREERRQKNAKADRQMDWLVGNYERTEERESSQVDRIVG